jgi:hypothetical protein
VLKLFVKGTKPIEIAIKFNISADEVHRGYIENIEVYRKLNLQNFIFIS